MKNKIIFIVLTTASTFLFGKYLWNGYFHPQLGLVYAQGKNPDEKNEKKVGEKGKPALEGEAKDGVEDGAKKENKTNKEEKITLPTEMPAINPETFRMIETIEKKNRELKRREEELRIKELKIKAIEAKVNKDLEKIEKGLSQSKQQLEVQDKKTKENVEALIKVYSSMKPDEAANLIEAIDDDLALKIVSGMKSKIAGKVLSQLDVKVAKRISETLAGKKIKKKEMIEDEMTNQTKK